MNAPSNGPGQMSREDAAAALPEKVVDFFLFRRDWLVRNEEQVESTCASGLLLKQCEDGTEHFYERIGERTGSVVGSRSAALGAAGGGNRLKSGKGFKVPFAKKHYRS